MSALWSDRKRWVLFGLPLTFTKYSLTSEKFIIESGLLTKREEEIRLYRIVDMTLQRTLFQRMAGLGTIHCDTLDKSTPIIEIKNIKDSKNVKEMLSDAIEAERVRKRVTTRETMIMDDGFDVDDLENGDFDVEH